MEKTLSQEEIDSLLNITSDNSDNIDYQNKQASDFIPDDHDSFDSLHKHLIQAYNKIKSLELKIFQLEENIKNIENKNNDLLEKMKTIKFLTKE
jgi:predicted  nucleic acid-binding Zn-ribbon protein